MRVAVEGCGHGTLNAIYASIEKACEINGLPMVDLLIIGGDFQAVRNAFDLSCMSVPLKFRAMGDFHEYYSGARRAPILTIFVGGNHEASNHLFELYYGGWVAPNIYYMGAANVLCYGPLRIAGLSGIWKGYNYNKTHHERLPYNQDDIKSAYHVRELDVRKLLQIRTQVDVGISHDWPRGVEWLGNWRALFAQKDLFEADARAGTLGNQAARYVMDRLRPLYWFSAHLHCKFAAKVKYTQDVSSTSTLQDSNNASKVQQTTTNEDEIILDLDSESEATDLTSSKATKAQADSLQQPAEQLDSQVSEVVRAQLPPSFQKAAPARQVQLPFPEVITNDETQFLALDKCLPHRKFLQILDIEPVSSMDSSEPHILTYDREWLAITRAFAAELVVGDRNATSPRNSGQDHYLSLIIAEEAWVDEHIVHQGKLAVPHDFELTAPIYDASIPISTREQPKEYTNPQTTAFCKLLDIANPFDMSEEERAARMASGPAAEAGGHGVGRGGRGRGGRGGRSGRSSRGHGRGRGRGFA